MPLAAVPLYESNFRDPVLALREIAGQIERREFGEVGCVGVVVFGDTLEVFGLGPDSEAPSTALVLHAGFLRLSRALERHGREEE